MAASITDARERHRLLPICLAATLSGCVLTPHISAPHAAFQSRTDRVRIDNASLDLHLAVPAAPAANALVVYASGDGGWFGAAVDMFDVIGGAGYHAVGFSSKAFLKLSRANPPLRSVRELAREYDAIVTAARDQLQLPPSTPVVLTGWSRGAAFAALVGAEWRRHSDVAGVIAIGLSEGEDLQINGDGDENDDDPGAADQGSGGKRWPFAPYAQLARVRVPTAVIQSARDGYLPAARARLLFGNETPSRRFYEIAARNHRFSGGKPAFDAALVAALRWMTTPAASEDGS